MVTFPEAESRLRSLPPCTATGWAALTQACGQIAADTIRAPIDLPRLPRSAMDGYAVRARDASPAPPGPPTRLTCVDTLHAGDTPRHPLGPGECAAIATGAPLPAGADAVVPREHARTDGPSVRFLRPPTPGENVVAPGEEGRAGAVLASSGTRLTPRHIAALAAYGFARVPVRQPLRVALLATGDEVVEVGRPARPEQVYESSGPALEAEMGALGITVDRFPPCPDRQDALAARFTTLLAASYDAILTTGGVSAGDRDLVPAAWEHLGAHRCFWGVAAKPGKAIYVATAGPTWLFSLSGNPHAALAAFYTLVRPALAALAGLDLRDRRRGRLEGACELRRDRYRLIWAEPGAEPGGFRPLIGLSVLETLIHARALLLLPPGADALADGATVDLIALGGDPQ